MINEDEFEFGGRRVVAARAAGNCIACRQCVFEEVNCLRLRREGMIPSCRACERRDKIEVYFVKAGD